MTHNSPHAAWLSLMDVSGPFLAEPVLDKAFPQGLEQVDPLKRKTLRLAYDEWREAIDQNDPELHELHAAWIALVLKEGLELDEDRKEDILKPVEKLPQSLAHSILEHGLTLRPDFAVFNEREAKTPLLLVKTYSPDIPLDEPLNGDGWAASPAERIVELCRATGVRLALLTNGERWMLVDAPVGATTTFASWYARLWGAEPATLQSFLTLLGIRRFFVDRSEQLPALLDESLKFQEEVTDALGEQVRRAVEVLIQALDRADLDRNRELLKGVEPAELYEAGLTVMMRIVFLLAAEERGLLLLGDECFEANYAASTLRMQLRSESEEILERRWDAWSRLLSLSRAVYGGIEYEALRLPALGGSLFDPDRFPFLEGRPRGSNWRTDPAYPLPIDNRTVLLLLEAVQLFQGRTLSYRALDVEQIGHVYEGLLERTVVRATADTLDLDATKKAKKPWVSLDELDTATRKGMEAVEALLDERMGSSASRLRHDLEKQVDQSSSDKLLTACHGNQKLRDRVKPYYHLLRTDRWGYPLVYPEGTFMVAAGADRRETGTHYTPKSLTEAIVKETLEPVAYIGPAEGKPREGWALKSPTELLDLKICDPAMGSGAFLVQACRWLAERLVESWERSELEGQAVTSEGIVVDRGGTFDPLPRGAEDRMLTAKRLIAERCLYGVDINPLAVELAKLSLWLVTLAKNRPFGFLDHNLRSGDSLLGIRDITQLHYLDMNLGKNTSKKLFAHSIDEAVEEAVRLRATLRNQPIRDIRDVQVMAGLDALARQKLELPDLIADALVGEVLEAGGKNADTTVVSIEAGGALAGDRDKLTALKHRALRGLAVDRAEGIPARRPIHWPLEFPEVFSRQHGGFDSLIGNPPFMGGRKISSNLGELYSKYIKAEVFPGKKGSINLVLFFLVRAAYLARNKGTIGFVATSTITESDSREAGMVTLYQQATPFNAVSAQPWPGSAGVYIATLSLYKGSWSGAIYLNGKKEKAISTMLKPGADLPQRFSLTSNIGFCSDGVKVQGIGFVLDEVEATSILSRNPEYREILTRYIVGDDINNHLEQLSDRWVINFWNMAREHASKYDIAWQIVVERVKPYRDTLSRQVHESCFWKFWDRREEFFNKVQKKGRVLVASKLSKHFCITFGDPNFIYSEKVKVFDFSTFSAFSVLQSSLHSCWAREWGSSTGETPAYVGSTCFDTFPFPNFMLDARGSLLSDAQDASIENIGNRLFHHRLNLMKSKRIGLTNAYNLVHDPNVKEENIILFRNLFRELDASVVRSYNWNDISLEHDFHETKEGLRYTVSDQARSVILDRLIDLNHRIHLNTLRDASPSKGGLKKKKSDVEDNMETLWKNG